MFSAIAYAENNSWYWYMDNGLPGNDMAVPENAQEKDSDLLGMSGRISDQAQPQDDKEKPKYVPNEIIVKFKTEAALTLERTIIQKGEASGQVKIAASLDNLDKKHKVKKIDQIFKNFKKDRGKIELLKQKEALKKHFKERYSLDVVNLTKKEEHILKRLSRAPKDAKIPDLDRIYRLELEKGQSVEGAIAEYSKDPNVEYAEPNYIYQICALPLPIESYIPNDYYVEEVQNPGYWKEGSWGQGYPDLWGLQKIQAIEAHNLFDIDADGTFGPQETKPGAGVIVAVIDTGVDYNHPDLTANIWINEDEIEGDANGDGFPGIGGTDDDGDGLIDEDSQGISRFLEDGITPNPKWCNDIPADDDENGYADDIKGWDFANKDNNPMDGYGHGTHCSGTIAAIGNNSIGITGVAPFAKVMALKGLSDNGGGNITDLADCVHYATDNGADILSNSWGGIFLSQTLTDAFNYAYSLGCISIAAAGNDNDDVVNFSPANISTVMAVASSDHEDEKSDFSNYGDLIAVSAPGGDSTIGDGTNVCGRNILSLRSDNNSYPTDMYGDGKSIVGGNYYRSRGTSMACPHVAGLAALVLSAAPDLSNEDVRQRICDSADDVEALGPDIYCG
ncbi:MAG: S8 family peptidase, partial [Candidatus Omnitrophota bacterium]